MSVLAAPTNSAVEASEGHGLRAARQLGTLRDLGDGSDLRIGALVLRHEQHPVFVADISGRVMFMFGRTTASSNGTSSRLAKISSHSRS